MKIKYRYLSLFLILFIGCKTPKNSFTYTNDLIQETSPYLQQHAHNPVNWFAWHDETLEKAKKEQKLMLISIGYSACHWCHVMEKETFSDTTAARLMNTHFINIKIDKEERPDVDNHFMLVCQMAKGGSCGWPLSIIALPDGRPIWVGTYQPKKEWIETLNYFVKAQKDELPKLEDYANQIKQGIQTIDNQHFTNNGTKSFSRDDLPFVVDNIVKTLDFENGGQLGAPKFPTPGLFDFLLHYSMSDVGFRISDFDSVRTANRNPTPDIRNLLSEGTPLERGVTTTLDNMANGGIYDHLQGGFARYSTDAQWHVPHFEKMLYDNAQMVSLYSHAFQASKKIHPEGIGNPLYEKIVRQTLAFVEQEWLSSEGGFYTAFDADSKGEEGVFYTWKKAEIDKILGKNAAIFNDFYEITVTPSHAKRDDAERIHSDEAAGIKGGNWEAGKNILHQKKSISTLAKAYNLGEKDAEMLIENCKNALLQARNKRTKPNLDDKILTGWNALMLNGCIHAYRAFSDPHYLELALKNAQFILKNQVQKDGRLNRVFKFQADKNGRNTTPVNGFLEDYAYTIQAFISLYQVTFDEKWLFEAQKLADYVLAHFEDSKTGLFYFTSNLDTSPLGRHSDVFDNVLPNPNAILALAFLDLSTFLDKPLYGEKASKMMQTMYNAAITSGQSEAYFNWCKLFSTLINPPYEVAIVGKNAQKLRLDLMQYYVPNALFLGQNTEGGQLPLLEGKFQEGETYIYVCKDKVCKYPVKTVVEALKLLNIQKQ
jgi:uncharacterized protein